MTKRWTQRARVTAIFRGRNLPFIDVLRWSTRLPPRARENPLDLRRHLERIEVKIKSARDNGQLLLVSAVALSAFPLLALIHSDVVPVDISTFGTLMWAAIVVLAALCRVDELRLRRQRRRVLARRRGVRRG